jgi:hypothetical protein
MGIFRGSTKSVAVWIVLSGMVLANTLKDRSFYSDDFITFDEETVTYKLDNKIEEDGRITASRLRPVPDELYVPFNSENFYKIEGEWEVTWVTNDRGDIIYDALSDFDFEEEQRKDVEECSEKRAITGSRIIRNNQVRGIKCNKIKSYTRKMKAYKRLVASGKLNKKEAHKYRMELNNYVPLMIGYFVLIGESQVQIADDPDQIFKIVSIEEDKIHLFKQINNDPVNPLFEEVIAHKVERKKNNFIKVAKKPYAPIKKEIEKKVNKNNEAFISEDVSGLKLVKAFVPTRSKNILDITSLEGSLNLETEEGTNGRIDTMYVLVRGDGNTVKDVDFTIQGGEISTNYGTFNGIDSNGEVVSGIFHKIEKTYRVRISNGSPVFINSWFEFTSKDEEQKIYDRDTLADYDVSEQDVDRDAQDQKSISLNSNLRSRPAFNAQVLPVDGQRKSLESNIVPREQNQDELENNEENRVQARVKVFINDDGCLVDGDNYYVDHYGKDVEFPICVRNESNRDTALGNEDSFEDEREPASIEEELEYKNELNEDEKKYQAEKNGFDFSFNL